MTGTFKSFIFIKSRLLILFSGFLFFYCASSASAHHLDEESEFGQDFFKTQTLTGDWHGVRTQLWQRGLVPEIEYYADTFYNPTGGIRQELEYAGMVELDLHVDLFRVSGIRDTFALFSVIGTHGTNPSRGLDTPQTVSALEAENTIQLFQAWMETFFLQKLISLKIGIYSLDTEFDFKDSANLFINGAFGTGLDLSETGITGPAIFPNSALGLRLGLNLESGWYSQAAVLDGVPGIPGDNTGTRIRIDEDDGVQVAVEFGYEPKTLLDLFNKIGVGALVYTTEVPDRKFESSLEAPSRKGTYSIYGFVDWLLWQESESSSQGLKGLLRVGLADKNTARFVYDITGALVYTGLFTDRDSDRTGLGISLAHNADGFKIAQNNTGQPVDEFEVVLEGTHSFSVRPGINLQPTLQYFINPGSNPNLDDIFYLGLHLGINL